MKQPGIGEYSGAEAQAEIPQQKTWHRQLQVYAAIGWTSFLVAGFATMVFFAFFDPAEYQWLAGESLETIRMTGYGLGFFFFWLMTGLTGIIVAYLILSTRGEVWDRRAQDRTSADG